jgi:hypothetical protein
MARVMPMCPTMRLVSKGVVVAASLLTGCLDHGYGTGLATAVSRGGLLGPLNVELPFCKGSAHEGNMGTTLEVSMQDGGRAFRSQVSITRTGDRVLVSVSHAGPFRSVLLQPDACPTYDARVWLNQGVIHASVNLDCSLSLNGRFRATGHFDRCE